jgi:hypothetical protein
MGGHHPSTTRSRSRFLGIPILPTAIGGGLARYTKTAEALAAAYYLEPSPAERGLTPLCVGGEVLSLRAR